MLRMKIKLFLLFITYIFLPSSVVFSAQSQLDTVRQKGEMDNIEILLGLATKVYSQMPERSLQYAETALKISQQHHDHFSEAKTLRAIGDVYRKLDFDRLALPYYAKALEIFTAINKPELEAELYLLEGDVYYRMNKNDTTQILYTKSLTFYQKINNKPGIAQSLLKLGNTFWYSTNYDKALDYYLKALLIYETIKDRPGIAKVYNNIGSLYTVLGDHQKAVDFLEKSLEFYTDFDNAETLSELYFRLGDTYQKMKNYNKAITYLDMAKSIYASHHNERRSAYVDQSKAKIAFARGNVKQAILLAQTALENFEKHEYIQGQIDVNNNLGNYYIHEENFEKASFHLHQSLDLLNHLKSWELLKDTYLELSQLYAAENEYKKSLDYYELFQTVSDSVANQEKNARIAELQAKYEANKKEQVIQQKNIEINKSNELIKRQKVNLYLFGTGTVLILLLSFALYRQYRLLEIKGKKIERINTELDQRVKERTSALRLTQFSIEHAADPIFWIDQTGSFIYVNNSACLTLGFSTEELLHRKITDIIPAFSYSNWNQYWEMTKRDGSLVIETIFKRKLVLNFPVEMTLNYINHEEKEYSFAFVRDISDRKQKEENLRKAKEKAEEADNLKSAFLANMSHEIRTPMNAIIGFSDMLVQEDFTKEEKHEFAGIIKSSGDTLLKLIDDIINISLIEAGQLKFNIASYNLNSLLREVHLSFQGEKNRLNKNHIEINLSQANFDDHISIKTDKVRFQQILTNLVGNALKFTDSGQIEIGYSINHKELTIFVKDTGIGIPKDKIPFIFERFSKLNDDKKLYSGTGLGLTISKKLVAQMGGILTAESDYGKGSTFKFTIAYHYDKSVKSSQTPKKSPQIETGTFMWSDKSLLIVEDVESNFQFLATALRKTGVKIQWAKNGNEAINYCRISNPDAILMDIQLPEKSGYDVTREILTLYPDIPIIAQTAYAFNDEKEKIIEAGCVDYITKPINTQILYETIHKYFKTEVI
jgi:PAS domain S-box-containing protein